MSSLGWVGYGLIRFFGQDDKEFSSLVDYALGKQETAVVFHYLFANCKAYARALIIIAIEPLKDPEYFVLVFFFKSDAIVLHTYAGICSAFYIQILFLLSGERFFADHYMRIIRLRKFHGIADQVLE